MARRNVYILSGIGLLLLLVLYWFFLLSPVREDISETERLIDEERQALQIAQTKLAQLEQTAAEAKRNNARLIELAKMVPVENEVPSLLLQVQDLAAESGIEFMSISPNAPAGESELAPIPLSLTFTGSFFDVNDFLYRAEQLAAGPGRLLASAEVGLAAEQSNAGTSPDLQVTITLDAYKRSAPVYLEPLAPEPPAPVQASNDGGLPGEVTPDGEPTQPAPADQAAAFQPN